MRAQKRKKRLAVADATNARKAARAAAASTPDASDASGKRALVGASHKRVRSASSSSSTSEAAALAAASPTAQLAASAAAALSEEALVSPVMAEARSGKKKKKKRVDASPTPSAGETVEESFVVSEGEVSGDMVEVASFVLGFLDSSPPYSSPLHEAVASHLTLEIKLRGRTVLVKRKRQQGADKKTKLARPSARPSPLLSTLFVDGSDPQLTTTSTLQLTAVPTSIAHRLKSLRISHVPLDPVHLADPSRGLARFASLQHLSLQSNGLLQFPHSIRNMRTLRFVSLADNRLRGTVSAAWFSDLPKLVSVDLKKNQFQQLDPAFHKLLQRQSLRMLNLEGNPISSVPQVVQQAAGTCRILVDAKAPEAASDDDDDTPLPPISRNKRPLVRENSKMARPAVRPRIRAPQLDEEDDEEDDDDDDPSPAVSPTPSSSSSASSKRKHHSIDFSSPPPPVRSLAQKRRRPDTGLRATRKYQQGYLDFFDTIEDGFLDTGRRSAYADCTLEQLEQVPMDLGEREVVMVDARRDPDLAKAKQQAVSLLASCGGPDEHDDELRAKVLGMFVSDYMGGRLDSLSHDTEALVAQEDHQVQQQLRANSSRGVLPLLPSHLPDGHTLPPPANPAPPSSFAPPALSKPTPMQLLYDRCNNCIREIKLELNSNVVPIGRIRHGLCRHRAILYKYLADSLVPRLPVALTRGFREHGVPHAWNVVQLRQPNGSGGFTSRELILDTLDAPLELRDMKPTDSSLWSYFPSYLVSQAVGNQEPGDLRQAELGREIGGGSYAKVHLARLPSGAYCAVKVCDNMRLSRRDFEQMLRELYVMPWLAHENIVQFLGYVIGTTHMRVFMEYVRGVSLLDDIKRRRTEHEPYHVIELYLLALRMARALAYLHSQGVIHRDLKSENVLVGAALPFSERADVDHEQPSRSKELPPLVLADVKLCDFNVAMHLRKHGDQPVEYGGTIRWMAPEVLRTMPPNAAGVPEHMRAAIRGLAHPVRVPGAPDTTADLPMDGSSSAATSDREQDAQHTFGKVGAAADVWAFGMILFECLSLQLPFDGLTPEKILELISTGKGVREQADALTVKLGDERPIDRQPIPGIEEALGQTSAAALQSSLSSSTAAPSRRNRIRRLHRSRLVNLMLACMDPKPERRPSAEDIVAALVDDLPKQLRELETCNALNREPSRRQIELRRVEATMRAKLKAKRPPKPRRKVTHMSAEQRAQLKAQRRAASSSSPASAAASSSSSSSSPTKRQRS